MADGHVTFYGECGDGEDCRVCRGFSGEALEYAESFAEDIGTWRPNSGKEKYLL